MSEIQNISFKPLLNRKFFQTAGEQNTSLQATSERAKENSQTLETYGSSGNIHSEQPSARGNNIDVII